GELFISMAKEGGTIGGLMEAFGSAISMSLQYGVPLEVLVNKFSHMRFEPMGHTKNPDIRIAKSLVDYIFRWLGITFLPGYREANKGLFAEEGTAEKKLGDATKTQEPGARSSGSSGKTPKAGEGGSVSSAAGNPKTTPVQKAPLTKPASNGTHLGTNGHGTKMSIVEENAAMLHRAGVAMHIDQNSGVVAREEQFAGFQLDAPSCDNCG